MVNNGDEHWKPFEDLTTDPLFQTDPLSMQWFCLANEYAFEDMEVYKETIFRNTRDVLNNIPEIFTSGKHASIQVSTADERMHACFIDVRYTGKEGEKPDLTEINSRLRRKFNQAGLAFHPRDSFGFPHTNTTIIAEQEKELVMRITLGLDPTDARLISEFFEELAEE